MTSKHSPQALVLDGSIALSWFFADEADTYADAIAHHLPRLRVVVPPLWYLEIANVLLVGERRKRSQRADTDQWLIYMRSLPIDVDEDGAVHAWSETLTLARSHGLSAYDGAYLELALRRGLPLATLDHRLRKAAEACGVLLYTLPEEAAK